MGSGFKSLVGHLDLAVGEPKDLPAPTVRGKYVQGGVPVDDPRGGGGDHLCLPGPGQSAGKLDFGPWEQIFYGEYDGRRRKRVLVKIIGE